MVNKTVISPSPWTIPLTFRRTSQHHNTMERRNVPIRGKDAMEGGAMGNSRCPAATDRKVYINDEDVQLAVRYHITPAQLRVHNPNRGCRIHSPFLEIYLSSKDITKAHLHPSGQKEFRLFAISPLSGTPFGTLEPLLEFGHDANS
ncbi:hypothetical protein PUN28_001937 [Cardiocondyla obscurior]|uniref:LysM domain-containing protein n=1 Tax=Cardiocondyla obscurior TaxID=286306 RepID=A0AAW2GRX8_9HYME